MTLAPGSVLNHYRIESLVGTGGMGSVYRATDARLGRHVAIKVLSRDAARDDVRLQRFFREARTVSTLNHPNILTLHEIGESDSGPYLVTEMVLGRTVREILREGPVDVGRALDLGIQAARGLAKAHEAGIIHRDIKPANLMVTDDGYVKILDFGLAKLLGSEAVLTEAGVDPNLTREGAVVGTPAYMSPEQLGGLSVDGRCDLFSLGVVLYEAISGANPFLRGNLADTLAAILGYDPPPLAREVPGVSTSLSEIVDRLLSKSPDRRIRSASELGALLEQQRSGEIGSATGSPRPLRRRTAFLWGGAAAALAAAVFVRGGLLTNPADDPAEPARPRVMAGLVPPATSQVPRGMVGVAVVPFEDDSGEPALRDADVGHLLANAFTQILTDVAGYYVISERRILALTETRGLRPDEAATDPGFGAALAGELGAGALLSGRLSRLGETFVLSASLLELPSDVVLKSFQAQSETVEGLLEDLPELVTARILGPGTPLPEGTPPETVPTRSIDAYSHYLRGEDLLIEGIWEDAVEELNLAVEEDPEMGLAWSALSCAYSFSGDDVRARAAHQKASEFLHSLNEKERRWVELDGIWVTTGNGDQYLQKMQQYINDYPDDPRNFLYAGMGLEWLQNRPEDAIEWYETARELMPLNFPVVKTTADCYLKLGRRADAVRVLEEYAHHPFLGDDNRGRASEALDLIRNP